MTVLQHYRSSTSCLDSLSTKTAFETLQKNSEQLQLRYGSFKEKSLKSLKPAAICSSGGLVAYTDAVNVDWVWAKN